MRGYRDNWHYVIPIQSPWYERLTPLWATGDLIALVLELVGIVLWSVSGPISLIVAAIGLGFAIVGVIRLVKLDHIQITETIRISDHVEVTVETVDEDDECSSE
jgi:low affinity Fe/Cu permease